MGKGKDGLKSFFFFFNAYKQLTVSRGASSVQELCERWAVRPNEPYGFRGRKATLNLASALVSACP